MIDLKDRPLANTKLIGGRLCLDFLNTIGGRQHSRNPDLYTIREDRLNDYFDLLAWGIRVGLLSESEAQKLIREAVRNPAATNSVWKRAVALRESIYRISRAIYQKKQIPRADLDVLNRELRLAHSRMILTTEKDRFRWDWRKENLSFDKILSSIADSAAEMLTTADLSRLRQCPAEDCGWFFDDTSRNRSRQWCDMKDCGNIAKVRRFRSRS